MPRNTVFYFPTHPPNSLSPPKTKENSFVENVALLKS